MTQQEGRGDWSFTRDGADSSAEGDPQRIPAREWRWAQRHVPIACLDFMPIRTAKGRLEEIGLIMRDSPQGPGWSLVGGRIFFNEPAEEAALRHLALNLGEGVRFRARGWNEPDFICQYFTTPREGFPTDTRQHAISLTYLVELEGEPVPINEAHDLRWFSPDAPPMQLSFGQEAFLPRLIEIAHRRASLVRGQK